MTNDSENPKPPSSQETHADSGYLYHQQKPEPKSRRLGAGEKVRSSHPSPSQQHQAARMAMISNLKTTGIVGACMVLLLFISMYIARTTWEIKNDRLVSQPQSTSGLINPVEKVFSQSLLNERDDSRETSPAPSRKQLDTDSIRQAVFLSQRAEVLSRAGKHEEAIERYREALKIWPYLTKGWSEIGRIYLDLKDFPKAQIALERAIQNDPSSPDILNDLGVAHLFQNNVAEALDLFEAVTEIDPSYAPSYFNIALCHLASNAQEDAIQSLQYYMRLRPDDPRALKELAFMYANDQRYGDALNSLQLALTHAPEWPPLYFDAAATAALMGRVEESLRYLDKAEILTTPSIVYQIYKQPAFNDIRLSELGKIFEKEIADRARQRMLTPGALTPELENIITEPLSSSTPAI